MLGGWWFGCSPSSPDSNFLRVGNVFPNRRLSDNTLMTPKIRIAPSCASSPGGTPGSGLPTRRHSSIGPQERRGSTINLSPPTVSCFFYLSLSFGLCSVIYYLPRSVYGHSVSVWFFVCCGRSRSRFESHKRLSQTFYLFQFYFIVQKTLAFFSVHLQL